VIYLLPYKQSNYMKNADRSRSALGTGIY